MLRTWNYLWKWMSSWQEIVQNRPSFNKTKIQHINLRKWSSLKTTIHLFISPTYFSMCEQDVGLQTTDLILKLSHPQALIGLYCMLVFVITTFPFWNANFCNCMKLSFDLVTFYYTFVNSPFSFPVIHISLFSYSPSHLFQTSFIPFSIR